MSYESEAYGGSTSDRQTVERSNLVNKCEPSDEIMADKGFNDDGLFLPYEKAVNIPTFQKTKQDDCRDSHKRSKDFVKTCAC